ncbi:MAG: methyl-accepting chemotaxis protein, partial [Betaproteobacteria bacterium]
LSSAVAVFKLSSAESVRVIDQASRTEPQHAVRPAVPVAERNVAGAARPAARKPRPVAAASATSSAGGRSDDWNEF